MLIEQSVAKQYGVLPSEQSLLKYSDWVKMVSGLMDDTPLGRTVAVRMEHDREALKRFTPAQKQTQAEWRKFLLSKTTGAPDLSELQKLMAGLFGSAARR